MKDPDYISDKTAMSTSLLASCFKVKKIKDGATRETDRFRVSIPEYSRGLLVGYKTIQHSLRRKDFVKFMQKNRDNLIYAPDVKSY